MKELLRIVHAGGDSDRGKILKDYNMEICAGEILYIQGSDGSGIREVAEILSGDTPLFAGKIYVHGIEMKGYDRKKAFEQHIFPISGDGSIVYNLTVAENMELVRKKQSLMKPYFSKKMQKKVAGLLDNEGIAIFAGKQGAGLCSEEEVLLGILKAKMHEAKLVILEVLNSAFEGTYAKEICDLIKRLCQEGISFVILSEAYSCFAEIADRIQFVYRGRDLKEWTGLEQQVIRLLKNQNPDEPADSKERKELKKQTEKCSFLGIYDYEWENDRDIWSFLKEVKQQNPDFWEKNLKVSLPKQGVSIFEQVLVIPKESGNLWFNNLNIEDNLLLPVARRIAGSAYGVVRTNRTQHIMNRFYETLHVSPQIKEIKDLSKVHRKLFSIYRYELLKPEVIFLENPYWGLDSAEILQVRKYLKNLQEKGMKIVCCAKSIDEMKKDCSLIIQTNNARNARVFIEN